MASDVVLPPGTGGETADRGRFPCAGTTGNPGQDHRWRRLLSCSSGMRLPRGESRYYPGAATAGPHGST